MCDFKSDVFCLEYYENNKNNLNFLVIVVFNIIKTL